MIQFIECIIALMLIKIGHGIHRFAMGIIRLGVWFSPDDVHEKVKKFEKKR